MEKSKVVVMKCCSYNEKEVYEALNEGINMLGGIGTFVKKEDRILLKPNLLRKATKDKAITTHPSVFAAIARILKESGYNDVYYGDSPGGSGSRNPFQVAETCGIKEMADKFGIKEGDFYSCVKYEYLNGKYAKSFEISKEVALADKIINICKMKTHALERITGAIKNCYGFIYGLNKGKGHIKYPDSESFAGMLADLNSCFTPSLNIMDGIVAMEGNGPAAGEAVNMNVIIISEDAVSVDSVFCALVYLNPLLVPTNRYAKEASLGEYDWDNIEILGNTGCHTVKELQDKLGNKNFDVQRGSNNAKGALNLLSKLFIDKPYIIKDKCVGCGVCIASCPLPDKAISLGKDNKPKYDYKKCIKCFCCQEMCPKEAISVKKF